MAADITNVVTDASESETANPQEQLEAIIRARISQLSSQLDAIKNRDDLPPYTRLQLEAKLIDAKREMTALENTVE